MSDGGKYGSRGHDRYLARLARIVTREERAAQQRAARRQARRARGRGGRRWL